MKIRLAPLGIAALMLSVTGIDAQAPVPPSNSTETELLEQAVAGLSESVGISAGSAAEAIEESGQIGEFEDMYRDDPRFGAIWVTYEDGYRVHVRVTGSTVSSMQSELDALSRGLGRNVETHVGGASSSDLWKFARAVESSGNDVLFDLDFPNGRVVIYPGTDQSEVPRGFSDKHLLFSKERLELAKPLLGRAGADLWYWNGSQWTVPCTAGYMWGGWGVTGFATAAHCPDATSANPMSLTESWDSFTTIWEACPAGGTDIQAHTFSVVRDPRERMESKSGTRSPVPIEAVAGGFYVNQTVAKTGRWANSTSTSWGVVSGYGSINGSGVNSDCAGYGGTFQGLKTTALGNPGDSGGPILLLYGGLWYAGAMTSHSLSNGYAMGPFMNNVNPGSLGWGPGAHWCVKNNPCGVYD